MLAILFPLKTMESLENGLQPQSRATPLLPPATKLWQGNIFTGVCQSFCSGGSLSQHAPQVTWPGEGVSVQGGLCLGGSLSRGLCPGGLCLGGLCPGGLCPQGWVSVHRGGSLSTWGGSLSTWGGSLSEGVSVRETPRTVTRGRYSSYWNAFLFSMGAELLASSQSCRSLDVEAWCKWALTDRHVT